jgi:nitroreductase
MDVQEAIQVRKSVRSYDSKQVPDDALGRVLEAGRISPSASNLQPWHFIVVKDPERRKALSGGRYAKFLAESPVVIIGCGNTKASPKWYPIDVSIALQQMVIVATAEGLGTCWIGSFSEEEVRKAANIPQDYSVVAMLTLGYPKDKTDLSVKIDRSKSRKPLEKIVSYEVFGGPKRD